MGLKKYEIITVGSNKRVRALRSWQVGDRYVNIGDVGGIVYDEKTLSQDGACWLFRGNFGFPGARIGGDSIVDVAETTLSAAGTPNVDILGSSVVVGSKLQFAARQTAEDAVVLTAADFEQGSFNYAAGVNWEAWKTPSTRVVRSKAPIFAGGAATTIKISVPGYSVKAFVLDRDGLGITSTSTIASGAGVTLSVPAGQYFMLRLMKNPAADIVPADATAAQITFTGTYETKLSIVDSRVEINPATATGTAIFRPGGNHAISPGAKYPDSVIRNSKVAINGHATVSRTITLMAEFINTSAVIDATAGEVTIAGLYSNIKNLAASGILPVIANVAARSIIQSTDCDNFAVSPIIFPGMTAAQNANMPFIFQGCNVPDGEFQHHAKIANTYKNIDFAKAQADLGKAIASGPRLVSSEVEGMYRIHWSVLGALVESYDSVKALSVSKSTVASTYGTTIYKDAYLNGLFDIAGINVFGNKVRSHPLAQVLNVQPRAVQGTFNNTAKGQAITGVIYSTLFVCVPLPFRVNGSKGLILDGLPENVSASIFYTDLNNVIQLIESIPGGSSAIGSSAEGLLNMKAFIRFGKSDSGKITPADIVGVTVTVYNGCKIVNTGTTAVNMKGNIRVEDDATLVNASVTGTGYFGGNSVVYYNPAVWASLDVIGTVHMKDNAVFAPTALTGANALVRMEGNAKFIGSVDVASTNLSFIMRDNAVIEGKANTRSGVVMSGNSRVTASGQIMAASRGVLVMEENASIEANTTVIGAITLSGNYKGDVVKTWTGKRTITDVNEPEYDNIVKIQYDF